MFQFIFTVSVDIVKKYWRKKGWLKLWLKKFGGSKDGCQKLFGRKYGRE